MNHIGEIYGLITALFWMITSLAFEFASKKFGSLTVNLLRLTFAFVLLSVFSYFYRGVPFPIDATMHNWIWLFLSGIVGFVIGDFLLFKAFTIVGARVSQLVMALAPPIAAVVSWLLIGEKLSSKSILAMAVTLTGIGLVVMKRHENENGVKENKVKIAYPLAGILFALGGAVGQGTGLVLSKYGMENYDAFASSQIRVLSGIVGFSLVFLFTNRWINAINAFKDKKGMTGLLIGTVFGPFLGVSFSLLAVQNTSAGIAQTLMSIVPVLIIPASFYFFKEKITFKEIIGALIAVFGVTLFFIEF